MFESIKQGILGLLLFTSQWILPADEEAGLSITSVHPLETAQYEVSCKMDIAWNQQLEQLVDAGVPLRFRMVWVTDRSDTAGFYRTLYFNLVDYTYTFIDSTEDLKVKSRKYPMILLALKDFDRWQFHIPAMAEMCRVEALLLPSRVSQLNRMVDMSKIWGQKKVSVVFDPQEKVKKK